MIIQLILDVTLPDDVDPDSAAGEIFDHLCAVPEGTLDRVESFDTYDWVVAE